MQYFILSNLIWKIDIIALFQYVLDKATKALSKDENFSLDAVVDQDIFGMPGALNLQ